MTEKKILIYDDDIDILLVTAAILKRKGYATLTRENCNTMDSDISSFFPDLILMDNWMPQITGMEATKYLKGHHKFKNIPVVMFSANPNLESLALSAGADCIIKKPFDSAELVSTIEGFMADKTFNE
jgi:two-component system, OmpR family, alkaline phosphatase synthesis response regulator PhoP